MDGEVSDRELEGVSRAPADKQYKYFVTQCADRGEVWGVAKEGSDWAMIERDDNAPLLAV